MTDMGQRLIFHIDVNSAYLSWESVRRVQNGETDLREIPAVIGGDPEKRTGIVLAKSISAKRFGIVTGEPMMMALKKCPGLVSAAPDFRLYDRCSRAFKKICASYAPVMESYSIDEVFLDMSGTGYIYPDPVATAYEIRDKIREELGFTVNIGIGENKLCAKMASDFEKPDRVHTLWKEEIPQKMWPLPVRELFTVGRATAKRLNDADIRTIGELAHADPAYLCRLTGTKQGIHLYEFANGIDNSPVLDVPEEAKGYSVETTLEEDAEDAAGMRRVLLMQADTVAGRMRRDGKKARCIAVTYRTNLFVNRSHQRKLSAATDVTSEIYAVACELLDEFYNNEPVRLIGLALTDVDRGDYEQMTLFRDEKKERLRRLDTAVDQIREKYGRTSIRRASVMDDGERIGKKYLAQQDNEQEER